ncbi:hypothetical protein CLOP_g22133 [Closterium sp. NIES-67]|nr:hypothetical protein CLOP_g22133 [Closterium sp. NIES-67]
MPRPRVQTAVWSSKAPKHHGGQRQSQNAPLFYRTAPITSTNSRPRFPASDPLVPAYPFEPFDSSPNPLIPSSERLSPLPEPHSPPPEPLPSSLRSLSDHPYSNNVQPRHSNDSRPKQSQQSHNRHSQGPTSRADKVRPYKYSTPHADSGPQTEQRMPEQRMSEEANGTEAAFRSRRSPGNSSGGSSSGGFHTPPSDISPGSASPLYAQRASQSTAHHTRETASRRQHGNGRESEPNGGRQGPNGHRLNDADGHCQPAAATDRGETPSPSLSHSHPGGAVSPTGTEAANRNRLSSSSLRAPSLVASSGPAPSAPGPLSESVLPLISSAIALCNRIVHLATSTSTSSKNHSSARGRSASLPTSPSASPFRPTASPLPPIRNTALRLAAERVSQRIKQLLPILIQLQGPAAPSLAADPRALFIIQRLVTELETTVVALQACSRSSGNPLASLRRFFGRRHLSLSAFSPFASSSSCAVTRTDSHAGPPAGPNPVSLGAEPPLSRALSSASTTSIPFTSSHSSCSSALTSQLKACLAEIRQCHTECLLLLGQGFTVYSRTQSLGGGSSLGRGEGGGERGGEGGGGGGGGTRGIGEGYGFRQQQERQQQQEEREQQRRRSLEDIAFPSSSMVDKSLFMGGGHSTVGTTRVGGGKHSGSRGVSSSSGAARAASPPAPAPAPAPVSGSGSGSGSAAAAALLPPSRRAATSTRNKPSSSSTHSGTRTPPSALAAAPPPGMLRPLSPPIPLTTSAPPTPPHPPLRLLPSGASSPRSSTATGASAFSAGPAAARQLVASLSRGSVLEKRAALAALLELSESSDMGKLHVTAAGAVPVIAVLLNLPDLGGSFGSSSFGSSGGPGGVGGAAGAGGSSNAAGGASSSRNGSGNQGVTASIIGEQIKVASLKLLLSLVSLNENRAVVVKAGCVRILVTTLRTGSPDLRAVAARVLLKLAVGGGGAGGDNSKVLIAASEAILSLVAILQSHTDPAAKQEAADAIVHLTANNEKNQIAVAEAGAIPSLVGMLRDGGPGEQERAALALGTLAVNSSDNKLAIAAAGAVPLLLDLLFHAVTAANGAATADAEAVASGASGGASGGGRGGEGASTSASAGVSRVAGVSGDSLPPFLSSSSAAAPSPPRATAKTCAWTLYVLSSHPVSASFILANDGLEIAHKVYKEGPSETRYWAGHLLLLLDPDFRPEKQASFRKYAWTSPTSALVSRQQQQQQRMAPGTPPLQQQQQQEVQQYPRAVSTDSVLLSHQPHTAQQQQQQQQRMAAAGSTSSLQQLLLPNSQSTGRRLRKQKSRFVTQL